MIKQTCMVDFRLRGDGYGSGQRDMLRDIAECRLRGVWTPEEHALWIRRTNSLLGSIQGRPEYRRNQAYFAGQLRVLRSNKAKCYSQSDRNVLESENVSGGKPVWEQIAKSVYLDKDQTAALLIFEDDTVAIQLRYVGDALIPLDFNQAVKLGCALLAHTGSAGNEEEDVLEVFRRPTPISRQEWHWHTLYFSTNKEAETAKKYIDAQCNVCCTTLPCRSNEYEVSFFTDYEFDGMFRTHLLTNIGVSPTATLFNENTEAMLDRERLEQEPTILQVAMALILTILLLPFAYASFLAYMPKVLLEHFTREKWFAGCHLRTDYYRNL